MWLKVIILGRDAYGWTFQMNLSVFLSRECVWVIGSLCWHKPMILYCISPSLNKLPSEFIIELFYFPLISLSCFILYYPEWSFFILSSFSSCLSFCVTTTLHPNNLLCATSFSRFHLFLAPPFLFVVFPLMTYGYKHKWKWWGRFSHIFCLRKPWHPRWGTYGGQWSIPNLISLNDNSGVGGGLVDSWCGPHSPSNENEDGSSHPLVYLEVVACLTYRVHYHKEIKVKIVS